jgi:hypothetical protein
MRGSTSSVRASERALGKSTLSVVAGLIPAIHALVLAKRRQKGVDARDKRRQAWA